MTLSRFATPLLCAAVLTLTACGGNAAPTPETKASDSFLASLKADYPVSFAKIADGVWVHTTNYKLPGQSPIGSNGLVVVDGEDVVLVDGAWGELATVALLEAIKTEVGKPITKMIVTHHHPDKVSGVDAAERVGIQVYTHPDTPVLAARSGFAVPNTSVAALKDPRSRAKIGGLEVTFPGEAHAPDNLVVYVPEAAVLYAGCAVRGAETTTLGNIEDANLTAWPETLRFIKGVYKDAKIVVPGHGKGGDISLPDHTLKLLAAMVNTEAGKGSDKPVKTAKEVEDLK
jgi:metallo-beta-lactamase class B VIM